MPLDGLKLGHYRLLRVIGSGGMGEIYLGEDTRITRRVAVKIIRTEMSPHPDSSAIVEAGRLFQREMRAIITLDHPRILPLYDFGEEQVNGSTLTYMVMPYRGEGSLSDWLRQRKDNPLSFQDVSFLVDQASEALQHAHDRSIIHQDVKPSNFLVLNRAHEPNRPELFLSDFGIAKLISNTGSASQSVRGTPIYMAPEQWDGAPSAASDQYALAVMTYQILTGKVPFSGRMEQLMRQHFYVQAEPPSKHNERIPAALDAVILRGMAKRTQDRFPRMADFALAFRQAITRAGDLRATLALTNDEMAYGSHRTLTLPGGRKIPVMIPAGLADGHLMRLDGLGEPFYDGGPRGAVYITLKMAQQGQDSGKQVAMPQQDPPAAYLPVLAPEQGRVVPHTPVVPSTPSNPELPRMGEGGYGSGVQYAPAPPGSGVPGVSGGGYGSSGDIPVPHSVYGYGVQSPPTMPSNFRAGGPYTAPPPPLPLERAVPEERKRGLSTPIKAALVLVALALVVFGTAIVLAFNQQRSEETNQKNQNATATAAQATKVASDPAIIAQNATATVVAAHPYPKYFDNPQASNQPKLNVFDPLANSLHWRSYTNAEFGGVCTFKDGSLYASQSKPDRVFICDSKKTFTNFAAEFEMTIVKGECGGIAFRRAGDIDHIFTVCQDGTYRFDTYNATDSKTVISFSTSPLIKKGLNVKNVIGVKAVGNVMDFYVNGEWVDSSKEPEGQTGTVGPVASVGKDATEVAYKNATVWDVN